jgi:eukaryotic-like serine/threonine-protein kinase
MSDQQVPIGTLINNNYKIEQLISAGGMGEVFRGTNVFSGDSVAIKIVLQSLAHDPKVAALFKREAKVLCQLADQAIVRYYNFVHDAALDRFCLIMEFIDGLPLSDHVKGSGPLTLAEAQRLLKRLALGLERAHKMEVVHRDLSPDNVMLKGGMIDDAVLIDFGIAKSTEMSEATLFGQMAGKFKYVSPEQLGHFGGTIGPRTDIYGLALLMAAAVMGEPLDMGSSVVEAVNARRTIPELTGIYPELRPLFAHMLEPDPAMRPENMSQVIHFIDRPQDVPARYGPVIATAGDDRTVFMGNTPGQVTGYPQTQPPPPPPPMGIGVGAASMPPFSPSFVNQTTPPGVSVPGFAQPPGRVITASGSPGFLNASLPPSTALPVPQKSGGGGLVVGLLVLALIGGGAGFAWQRGYFSAAVVVPPPIAQGDTPAEDPPNAPPVDDPATGPEVPVVEDPTVEPTTDPAQSPPVEPTTAVTREAFLANFDAGACSLASRVDAGPSAGMIEGFATKAGAFAALPAAYETAFGNKPDIKDQVISDAQCPTLDFVRGAQEQGAPAPTVILDNDTDAGGSGISGRLSERRGRPTWMALVSPDGLVYNVTSQLTNQPDGSATFSFRVAASSETKPKPFLIIAVSSDEALTSTIALDGMPAQQLLPLILAEIRGRNGKAGVGLAWFVQMP